MSSSYISTLNFISQQLTIYLSITIFIFGIIGGLLNIIIFLSLKIFRENICVFYLIIMSLVNLGVLITGLLTRTMISGFSIDWTSSSLFYCKFRLYSLQTCTSITFTCLCLATIDQYISTSTYPYWQQWRNMKKARILTIIFCLIWLLEESPCLIYYDIITSIGKASCTILNTFFQKINTYLNIFVFIGILPIFVTVLFGLLAYNNIQKLSHRTVPIIRRELDKQLTVMVLLQVIFNFFFVMPYCIMTIIYSTFKSNDLNTAAQIEFMYILSICLYYLTFAVSKIILEQYEIFFYFQAPFYIYIWASKRFRRQS
jgi:hypothetical protein